MKQKYLISKDQKAHRMTIQEYAELDKDMFSLVCEETYNSDKIKAAVSEGKEALIQILRTPNLYPVAEYADKIADSVNELFKQKGQESVEIEFDDIEALKKEKEAREVENDNGSVALDDLLNEDMDEDEETENSENEDEEDDNNVSEIDEDALDLFDNEDEADDEDNND